MKQDLLNSLHVTMIKHRRHMHRYPELSFQELNTSAYIVDVLKELGIETRTKVGGNGVIGTIRGKYPGKTVVLRADMDALPIQDEKTCEYASRVPGVMHACGHDGHTATLLGVAEYYAAVRDELYGEIRFLFQPAEEVCPGGALAMIKEGALDGADVIYGIHLWTPIPLGTVASRPGAMMASTDEFIIDVYGRGGHGGMPHAAVDSVVAGSALVLQLQSVVSRSVNPLDPAVVTIGSIHGGTAQNVIADTCRLAGTVRCFQEETRGIIRERIRQLAEGTGQAYGTGISIDYITGYPSLVNDIREYERFRLIASKLESVIPELSPQIMPAEDFAYYLQKIPGCFMLVGAGNSDKGANYPHHHPKFDFDEEAMLHAATLMISMAESYQQEHRPAL